MRHIRHHYIDNLIKGVLFFSLLLLVSSVRAQEPTDTVKSLSGVEIETSVDKAEMYIGDLITYKLTILYDSTLELIPPPLGANLGAFDVKDYQSDIITRLDDGRIKSENIFVLSTFTTGKYIIPPIPVAFNLPDGTRKVVLSEAVPITVKSLLSKAGDSLDIKPLKPQYEFKRDYSRYFLWGGLGLLLLLAIALFVWMKLRKKKEETEPVDLRPPWEIAFERLAVLKQEVLPEKGHFKQYYIELSEILRWYLGKIYNHNVLDMTTEEFMEQFEYEELPGTVFEDTKAFLQHADLVKFARLEPGIERTREDFETVHHIIERVRVDYLQKQQTVVSAGATDSQDISVTSGGKQ